MALSPVFERLQKLLKKLPGLGYRSAERVALYLTLEKPEVSQELIAVLQEAGAMIKACDECGHLTEEPLCSICSSEDRDGDVICVVEHVPDLYAIDRASVYRGKYHVLHGKLSPLQGVHPGDLNLQSLKKRLESELVGEVILALSNDVEGEATCHYIQKNILNDFLARGGVITRIGFGLPSGGGVVYADTQTLKSAFQGRRNLTDLS